MLDAHMRTRKDYSELRLSSHGLVLQLDIERALVAGAWASVIVMSQSVIEATLRDLQTHDYTQKAVDLFLGQEDLERMRSIRNELIHAQAPGTPSKLWTVPNGDYQACFAALESDAKKVYILMLEAIYANSEA